MNILADRARAAAPFLAGALSLAVVPFASWFAPTALPARAADTLALGLVSATLLVGLSLPVRLARTWRRAGGGSPSPKSRPVLFVATLALMTLTLTQLLVVPLPETVTRKLVTCSESWALTGEYMTGPSRGALGVFTWAGKRAASCLTRYSLICQLRETLRPRPGLSDADRIMAYLVGLKKCMVTQAAVPHNARGWETVLSGVGCCDQVNSVAADIFAGEFTVSQTYCVHVPSPHEGHVIGRVWSPGGGHWLYYDLWGDELVVFKIAEGGRVDYLARRQPLDETFVGPSLREALPRLYMRVPQGWVLNTHAPTLFRRLVRKLGALLTRPAPAPVARNAQKAWQAPPEPAGPRPSAQFVHAYARARLDHLFGRPDLARTVYLELGNATTAKGIGRAEQILRQAARLFAKFLGDSASPRRRQNDPSREP